MVTLNATCGCILIAYNPVGVGATSEESEMDEIGSFGLTNSGGFVCAGKVEYQNPGGKWATTGAWGTIDNPGQSYFDPGDKGVDSGATVKIHVDIRLGRDRDGGEQFTYTKGSSSCATYTITGAADTAHLEYNGITQR